MRKAKQATAKNVMVLMVDSTDHVTGKTGLTLTITASKDGGAFSAISPTVTERGNGWYSVALTTAHTDTLGDLALHITGTAADPADMVLLVEAGATDADVSTRLATAGYTAPPTAASIRAEIDTNSTKLDVTVGSRLSTASYTAPDNTGIANIYALVDTEVAAILAAVDTEVGAIKAKTDNLPASPAAVGSAMTVAVGGIQSTSFAAGAIDSAALAANAIGASELAASAAEAIADALLLRSIASGANGGRTVRDALRALRNRVRLAAGNLEVYQEDDATLAWQAPVTTGTRDPLTEVNPT